MNAPDPIAIALAEDIGSGDVTVRYFIEQTRSAKARIVAKVAGVVAGSSVAAAVFSRVDPALRVQIERGDGERFAPGDCVLKVEGVAGSILTAERVALNFIQQLSGVATLTRLFVDAVQGTGAQILDTRKTVPGLRTLQKAAVIAGGGVNHRMGLYDMAMVKDNHLLASGRTDSMQSAINRLWQMDIPVELEADTMKQVKAFLELEHVAVILLDNMTLDDMRAAVTMGKGKPVQFEASGGISLQTVRAVAETGVQRISVGALTHSAPAVDFSLDFESDV